MSKLGPKCQYFVWPPLFSSIALTLLGMEFTRASQVATGVTELENLRSSTFRLRMPHRCSIVFRSEDMLGQSTFTLSFFSKAVVVLEVCLGSLSCWNTARRPSFYFSMSQYMLAFMVPSMNCSSPLPAALMPPCWSSVSGSWQSSYSLRHLYVDQQFFFTDPQSSLPWGAMLNFQWPVWESESDNTKFNTAAPHSHLRP